MHNDLLYLYNLKIIDENILGPGKRIGIWVQGCNQRCEDCIAKDSWILDDAEYVYSISELSEEVYTLCSNDSEIKGVTISGGEPFLQVVALQVLLEQISQLNLDIICYTGLIYEDLIADSKNVEFISMLDILIDGPYVKEKNNNELWRGSSNQRFIFIGNKYSDKIKDKIINNKRRDIAFQVKDDNFFMIGIPPKGFDLEKIL